MQLFSADATRFSKKKFQKKISHENMKKLPSKVAHNRPNFFSVLSIWPKFEHPYWKFG